jgi:hypothetical protein
MTSGFGAAAVDGAGEVVVGAAWCVPLEHAATASIATPPSARILRLIASRELSHIASRIARACHKESGWDVNQGDDTTEVE